MVFINILGLNQDNIVQFKQEKEKEKKDMSKLLRILKIKFVSFFIVIFILLLFFWYYMTFFCGIYINTQVHLFIDTFLSFASSLVYPFFILLIPGIFRIYSLKYENKYLYKFSILTSFLF